MTRPLAALAVAVAAALSSCATPAPPVVVIPGDRCYVHDTTTTPPTIREIPCPDGAPAAP